MQKVIINTTAISATIEEKPGKGGVTMWAYEVLVCGAFWQGEEWGSVEAYDAAMEKLGTLMMDGSVQPQQAISFAFPGKSQGFVARALGTTQSAVSGWMSGRIKMAGPVRMHILRRLGYEWTDDGYRPVQ